MSDLEHSRELQEKFELYLLALIFTILGLAIQTAKFGTYRAADVSQILGWVSLTVSGVCGLWRMGWIPVELKTGAHVDVRTELTHWVKTRWKSTGAQLHGLRKERQELAEHADRGIQQVQIDDQPEPADTHELITTRDGIIQKGQFRLDQI
ncbi:hypothetical protein [Burkholderia cenocepacia]|uniref:hypothetical protein n=1 Tax=Burkholderia cenocepacia TaxID=95486 RepID=UPI002ABE82CE|nr:hypothetical protein [Burkholderia cenocepacia]